VWLSQEASDLIHHFKYGGYWSLATEMADIMRRHVQRPNGGVIVPIPLTLKRLRARGYNQAALLARALVAQWHLPMVETRLTRVRETRSQTALSPLAREANMTQAFRASPPPSVTVRDRFVPRETPAHRIILVDDILTTGATIAAAARALEHVGWSAIEVVTFARARPYALRLAG
jgi:ComF family protein